MMNAKEGLDSGRLAGLSGTEYDSIASFEHTRMHALLGDRSAVEALIVAYQSGTGTDPDQTKAFEWMRVAAANGITNVYLDLALAYRDGIGTAINPEGFWQYMKKAAAEERGAEAMFHLAQAYESGTFGQVSLEQAFEWTTNMAQTGAPGAMINVARAFRDGKGTTKNAQKYLEWARKAVSAARGARLRGLAAERGEAADPGHSPDDARDWALEDLPRALVDLADAEKASNAGPIAVEVETITEAALMASEALDIAIAKKQRVGGDLVEIMKRHCRNYLDEDGQIAIGQAAGWFNWMSKIARAIQSGYDENLFDCPENLADLVFAFALAYRDGNGTRKSNRDYRRWLEIAANVGSADALCRLALFDGPDNLSYSARLDRAADLGSSEAFIVKSVDACGLSGRKRTRLLSLLRELSGAVDEIKHRHLVKAANTEAVAHYTDLEALNNMLAVDLKSRRNVLRLYNIVYFNDPDEGKRLIDAEATGVSNPLKRFFEQDNQNVPIPFKDIDFFVHVGSFSLIEDRLDLWRAYGRDGNGYCVVTPTSVLEGSGKKPLMSGGWGKAQTATEITLYKVFYENDEVDKTLRLLSPVLDQILKVAQGSEFGGVGRIVRVLLSEILYLYKEVEYKSENEARIISALKLSAPHLLGREEGKRSRLFIETDPILFQSPGSRIIVGPKVSDKAAAMVDLQHRLSIQSWDNACTVVHSSTRYR